MSPWLIGLIALTGIAIAATLYLRRLPATKGGMKQMARDPRAMARMQRVFEERERLLNRAESLSDDDIRRGIEKVLAGDENAAGTWVQISEKIGRRIEPFLLRALDDPRAKAPEAKPAFGSASPFEAIAKALGHARSESLIPRLAPLLSSPHEHLRTTAALNIAMVGTPAATKPTLLALRDDAPIVRSYAMMGASWAIKLNHISEPFRRSVFEALQPVAAGETGFNDYYDRRACDTLMDLDATSALSHLNTARCLRMDNPHLCEVLEALNRAGARINPAILRSIFKACDDADSTGQSDHRTNSARAAALAALAIADPAAANAVLEAALDSDDEQVRAGAVEGFLKLQNLPDPNALWGAEDKTGGFQSLPRAVQHVIASVAFEAEVNNGGLSQYFFNSSGDHWPVALEAFREMGCPTCAGILEQAAHILGPAGTSQDRAKRIKAYARLSDKNEQPLDELSSRFYQRDEHLDAQRARYMVKHAQSIRPIAARLT